MLTDPLPQPTVTSNSQAAQLACKMERTRVLRILESLPKGAMPERVLQAIAAGTPAAVFETSQRRQNDVEAQGCAPSPATGGPQRLRAQSGAASATGETAARSMWRRVTARANAAQRARSDARNAKPSGTEALAARIDELAADVEIRHRHRHPALSRAAAGEKGPAT